MMLRWKEITYLHKRKKLFGKGSVTEATYKTKHLEIYNAGKRKWEFIPLVKEDVLITNDNIELSFGERNSLFHWSEK